MVIHTFVGLVIKPSRGDVARRWGEGNRQNNDSWGTVKHNIPALAIGDKNKIRSNVYKHRDETGEIGDGKREKTNNNIPTPMLPPPTLPRG